MSLLDISQLDLFFSNKNYDIRISRNARWIDQKCTPDILSTIADCIVVYLSEYKVEEFTSKDIWLNKYTVDNVEMIYKKPRPDNDKARNEYDKFFQQPMELLAYSGVLKKNKRRKRNIYEFVELQILEYISLSEKTLLIFL
jgi:hypothetical protein